MMAVAAARLDPYTCLYACVQTYLLARRHACVCACLNRTAGPDIVHECTHILPHVVYILSLCT